MSRIIRRKQGDPVSPEAIERLKRLAEMPDELINTDDIPERPFGTKPNLTRVTISERLQGQRKAS